MNEAGGGRESRGGGTSICLIENPNNFEIKEASNYISRCIKLLLRERRDPAMKATVMKRLQFLMFL